MFQLEQLLYTGNKEINNEQQRKKTQKTNIGQQMNEWTNEKIVIKNHVQMKNLFFLQWGCLKDIFYFAIYKFSLPLSLSPQITMWESKQKWKNPNLFLQKDRPIEEVAIMFFFSFHLYIHCILFIMLLPFWYWIHSHTHTHTPILPPFFWF